MTRARLRRGARKRAEAGELAERRARRVLARSLPPACAERPEGSDPCRHTWGEPVALSFAVGDQTVIVVCETCGGFVRRCRRCGRFHLVDRGPGGERSMPWWVTESWLKEHACARRDLTDAPIPFVWMPGVGEPPAFNLASYRAIEDEPGRYELEWFS